MESDITSVEGSSDGVRPAALQMADPAWVWGLSQGALRVVQGVVGAAIAAAVLGGAAILLDVTGILRWGSTTIVPGLLVPCAIGGGLLVLSGIWNLTSTEPGRPVGRRILSGGTIARVLLAAWGVLIVLLLTDSLLADTLHDFDRMTSAIVAASFACEVVLAACVARRLGQAGAKSLAWKAWAMVGVCVLLLPAVAIGSPEGQVLAGVAVVCLIALVVMLIPLLIVLGKARGVFARAAEQAWGRRMGPARLEVDEHGRVAMDIACGQCGYNLRGLEPHVGCPECGAASESSIEAHLARAQDPVWAGEVARGMTWLAVMFAAMIVLVVTTRMLIAVALWLGWRGGDWYRWVPLISNCALGLATLVGVWKVTVPTFGARQRADDRARRAARFCLGLRTVLGLRFWWAASGYPAVFLLIWTVGSTVLGWVGWLAFLRHGQRVAQRAGETELAERVQGAVGLVKWLLGLMVALSIWQYVGYLANIRAGGAAAPLSPRMVLSAVFDWAGFGLHIWFSVVMLRLAIAYRGRFRAIGLTNAPGAERAEGRDLAS